jgi:peptidoglycan/xylan/chitin deacetylase (PgdA/CDA1 family)
VTASAIASRRFLRCLWATLLAMSGLLRWARYRLRKTGAVLPLMFHRILSDADCSRTQSLPAIVLRERTFRELVAYVVRSYEPIDLQTWQPGVFSRKLPVAFTFDDGWIDTYTVAFPIACQHHIPFIVFVCPGLLDQDTPFWPERVLSLTHAMNPAMETGEAEELIEGLKRVSSVCRQQYLTDLGKRSPKDFQTVESIGPDRTVSWTAILEMAARGICIGSHTQTHQIVTMLSTDAARQELRESKAAIEGAFSKSCDTFAYPNGDCSSETRKLLVEAGYRLAFTTMCGAWTPNSDPLAIPRVNVCEDKVIGLNRRFSPTMFEYTTSWKAWRSMKAVRDRTPRLRQSTTVPA